MTWTVNVAYPVKGQVGIDEQAEAAIGRIAEMLHAPVTGSGSGLGMRDLDLEAADEDHAGYVQAALLSAVPGARISARDDATGSHLVANPESAIDSLACAQCGAEMWISQEGAAHHWGEGLDDIDHAADADHVAVPSGSFPGQP